MPRWTHGQLLALDLETTDKDPFTALPVSYALALRRSSDRISVDSRMVNPGVEVPEEARAIHGISTEIAQEEGIELEEFTGHMVEKLLWASTNDIPLCVMNGSYDLTVIDRLARQFFDDGLEERGWNGPVFDLFVLDKQFDRYRKGSRRLDALCAHYRVPLPEAHDAREDCVAALLVTLAMAEKYEYFAVKSAAENHRLQVKWYEQQTRSLDEYFEQHGKERVDPRTFDWPLHKAVTEA